MNQKSLCMHFETRLIALVLAVAPLLYFQPAFAEIKIPEISSPVIDSGEFFTNTEEQQIEARIKELHSAGGPQLQIWTLLSMEGEPIENLSLRAVEKWKLGNKDADNGLLLTLAKKERRYRLEVGQGLEGVIPDITASRLLRSTVQPSLRNGTPAVGVHLLLNEIANLSEVNLSTAPVVKRKRTSSVGFLVFIFFFIIVAILNRIGSALGWSSHSHSRWRSGHRWGGGGWGGGGGGGGWGGGGGGFSGGGSSGGW